MYKGNNCFRGKPYLLEEDENDLTASLRYNCLECWWGYAWGGGICNETNLAKILEFLSPISMLLLLYAL